MNKAHEQYGRSLDAVDAPVSRVPPRPMHGDPEQRKQSFEGPGVERNLRELGQDLGGELEITNRPAEGVPDRRRKSVELLARLAEVYDRRHLLGPRRSVSRGTWPPGPVPSPAAMVRVEQPGREPNVFPVHLALDEFEEEPVPVLCPGLELLKKSERRCVHRDARHRIRGGHAKASSPR